MEGGIGILLLLVLLVVAAVFGIAMYLTGGAILSRSDKDAGDEGGRRPRHKRPTGPVQENVDFVGTGARDDEKA